MLGAISRMIILIIYFALILGFYSPSYALEGEEVLKKVREKFANMKDFSADFKKTFYWSLAEQTQKFKGKLYIKKPHKFRLQTDQQTLVTDGKDLWNYTPDNNQALISRYGPQGNPDSPEKILFEYTQNYDPLYLGEDKMAGKKCHILELTSNSKDAYITKMKVWIDKKEWVTLKVKQMDVNEDVTTYLLSNVAIDSDLEDSIFQFRPPEGVEVIDTR